MHSGACFYARRCQSRRGGCHGPFFEGLKPDPAIRLLGPQAQGSRRQILPWAYFPGLAYSPCQSVTGKGHAFLVAHGQGLGHGEGCTSGVLRNRCTVSSTSLPSRFNR